jgi:presenilin-like A22 family membrane protease
MKHDFKITAILVLFFFIAQVVGLFIVYQYVPVNIIDGKVEVGEIKPLPGGIERPQINPEISWLYIFIAIIIGTTLVLLLMKFKKKSMWKSWFMISVVTCITFSLTPFIGAWAAFISAIILGLWKIFKPNFFIHNLTEIFIYGGLASIFVPIFVSTSDKTILLMPSTIFSAFMLLLVISIYDMIAVWQSKHMVKLANFQTDSKVFAGIVIPYSKQSGKIYYNNNEFSKQSLKKDSEKVLKESKMKSTALNHNSKIEKNIHKLEKIESKNSNKKMTENDTPSTAILGGGDIGFPLIFSGAIMIQYGLMKTLVMPFTITLALLGLFIWSKKGKFYPAMPFLSLGCLLGYLIVILL